MRSSGRIASIAIAISATTSGSSPVLASPQGTAAIAQSIGMCERATQGGRMVFPPDAQVYFGAFDVGTTKGLSNLPDLIKRYAKTGALAAVDAPSLFLRFSAPNGETWSVIRAKTFTCDVVATGFRGSETDQDVLNEMTRNGWVLVKSVPPAVPNGLSQYVLTKMLPASGDPTYGIRAHIKSMGFADSLANGVQMEIDLVAGQLSSRQTQKP
jgi:hypothetical protein